MLKSKIVLAILILTIGFAAQAQERILDGRQYALQLGIRLNLTVADIMNEFNKIKLNLPKEKNIEALESGIAGMAKFAAAACSYSNDLTEDDWNDVGSLYVQILDREATQEDLDAAIINKDGRFAYYANCLKIALSPEMILIPDDGLETNPSGVTNERH